MDSDPIPNIPIPTPTNSSNSTPRPSLTTSSTSARKSFLQKLPVTLPKRKSVIPSTKPNPHPRRFLPFLPSRAFRKTNNRTGSSGSGGATDDGVIAQLVIRVLAGRNLVGKDKNGSSDPFLVIRFGGKRVQSCTIRKCLDPTWGPQSNENSNAELSTISEVGKSSNEVGVGPEVKLQVDVFEESRGWKEHVEVVCWDSDRVGKQYLGEISLGLQDFFGRSETWKDGIPPLGFFDEDNKPIWFPIQSSRSRATVSGDLLVQIGFVDPITSQPLSNINREKLIKILQRLSEEEESSRRTSKEERVLLASPTESVGTTPISQYLPLGTSPPRIYVPLEGEGEEEEEEGSSSDSESSSESSDDDKSVTSGASSDDEAEVEGEEDIIEPLSPQDITTPASDYFSISRDNHNSTASTSIDPLDSSILPSISSIPITVTPPPLSPSPLTTIQSEEINASISSSLPSQPPSTSPSISFIPPPNIRTSSTNSLRKGISSFMKRKGSSLKGTTSGGGGQTESEGNGTNSDIASGSGSNSREEVKEKRKRFSRKKTQSSSVTLLGEEEQELVDEKKSKGKRFRRKKGKSIAVEEELEEGVIKDDRKSRRNKRSKARKSKRDYKYEDDDDIFGLVQIEIRGAKDLPKFANMLRTSWDMDPFVVISFGQKIFRTRVIRHQLNPVWDEKLFFHVRRTEVGWTINFNIYDWDKMSSNDYVGEISVPLEELLGTTIQPDDRGLYPTTSEGKLIGDEFQEHNLNIRIEDPEKWGTPTLQIRAKFTPYDALRQQFWRTYLQQYDIDESGAFSHLEIFSMLDSLGSTLSKTTISSFFYRFVKTPDMELSADEVVICLEQTLRQPLEEKRPIDESLDSGLVTPNLNTIDDPTDFPTPTDLSKNMETIQVGEEVVTNKELGTVVKAGGANFSTDTSTTTSTKASNNVDTSTAQLSDDEGSPEDSVERVINIQQCPLCRKPRLNNKMEVDIITHIAICASTDPRSVNRIVVGNFVTASQAQRKWFTKVISKATNGAYSLGANSANIIVQDRQTGMLQEEKISVYIRLGIRLAYKGMGKSGGMEGARIRKMLESMTIKQGVRFNSPNSVREIQPFIDFHNLPMSEVLEPMSSFKTFNDFFYRKLKPEARPVSDPDDPKTLVSPADCRAMFFETITEATTFWIKGREFSIARLLGEGFKDKVHIYEGGSLAIFRLAPQDYHRYHSPVDGIMGPYHKIAGKYFTVNPMAVRSAIDIYGENVRVVAPIYSPVFGEVMNVWVGAMLVGSIDFTKHEGDHVARGEEIGYFAFGGSTIITIFPPGVVKFDEDLITNSRSSLETLVRMGSRIGRKIGA